jgi:hypothetical protein
MILRPDISNEEHPLYNSNYSINTNEIQDLFTNVKQWIGNQVPGGIIYGEARLGKSTAIDCLETMLRYEYGVTLPIFRMNMTSHVLNEKNFYQQFLSDVGHDFNKGTAYEKKERLINLFTFCAQEANSKKIILFIDEANFLEEREYDWLMDIYNRLMNKKIRMTTLLFGTTDILSKRKVFIQNNKQQLIGRFMVFEYHFHGIRDIKDLQICLASYDYMLKYPYDSEWTYTKYFFPETFEEGYRLSSDAETLFSCFEKISKSVNNKTKLEIPMQYVISTINICLKTYGADGEGMSKPGVKEWRTSVDNSGFLLAERAMLSFQEENNKKTKGA